MKRCHQCGAPWISEKKQPSFKEYCDGCAAYLHCCMNCVHHDDRYHNECAIPDTEWVPDKEHANFCEEFQYEDADAPRPSRQESVDKALAALFGDGPVATAEDPSLDSLRRLFGD